MKAVVLLALCFVGTVFAAHVQSSGLAWQGTWSEGKRGFGGNLYICVDLDTNTAHGTYSNMGLISGVLKGTSFVGEWYEAGYDRPFGTFSLTISGTSFSGSWSYYSGSSNATDGSFSWTGTRSSGVRPSKEQCLVPAPGRDISGTYENVEYICYNDNEAFENTNNRAVYGTFVNFGSVGGYSPDNGYSVAMSDFFYTPGEDPDQYRPENNAAVFGPCQPPNCNSPNNNHDSALIHTEKIVIGALVDSATFCGFFWEGFYNDQITDGAICFSRSNLERPSDSACGTFSDLQGDRAADLGNTERLLEEIQRVLDALTLPSVVIVPGPFDGDDDNYTPGFFDRFSTKSSATPISTGETPGTPGATPTTITDTFTSTTYTTGETSFFTTVDFTSDFSTGSFSSVVVVPVATILLLAVTLF